MNRLILWWRETKAEETEANIRIGRDERYFEAEGQAYRTASQVLPFPMFVAIIAGMIWLPDMISKAAILRLAFVSTLLIMVSYWMTAKLVMARKGVQWREPMLTPRHLVVQTMVVTIPSMGLLFVFDSMLGSSPSWDYTIFGGIVFGLTYFGITRWRSRQSDMGDLE